MAIDMAEETSPCWEALGLKDIRSSPKVKAYIEKANEQMAAIGYTEHGIRHAGLVAAIARNLLSSLERPSRTCELAAIAGYLHDIGNVISRHNHPQIGASMAFVLLNELNMDPIEIGLIIGAIGNHEEPEGVPINELAAAVIIADKSDVHKTRVQATDPAQWDIHDRVNLAVEKSRLNIDQSAMSVTLDLTINVEVATVMEYFEIECHSA